MSDASVQFKKLAEKGWAMTPRGHTREFPNYGAFLKDTEVARIEGFLNESGGTGWSIYYNDPFRYLVTDQYRSYSLADAKASVIKGIDGVRSQVSIIESLFPCPFCGRMPEFLKRWVGDGRGEAEQFIALCRCGTKYDAIEKRGATLEALAFNWNTRWAAQEVEA